jgi:hypothetical protein
MSTVKRGLSLAAFLCLALLTSYASSNQLLYVQEGSHLVTYSVNPKTAATTKLGSLYIDALQNYPIQIFHSGSYIYILGFRSAADEYFSVHATTAAGVPTETPIQMLVVKPALTQFHIHPNGTFAYALYSSTDQTTRQFVGDIVLFTINLKTGELTNTTKAVTSFLPNYYFQTFLYGFNSTGSKFYIRAYVNFRDSVGSSYSSYTVNAKTGELGDATAFWGDDASIVGTAFSVISDKLIGLDSNYGVSGGPAGIKIYPNAVYPPNPPPNPAITCTVDMLAECGSTTGMQFDPSGKYLFLSTTANGTEVMAIDLTAKELKKTGASMPDAAQNGVIFSPDGTLAYAIKHPSEVLVYAFNPANGLFAAHSSFTVPFQIGQLIPAK